MDDPDYVDGTGKGNKKGYDGGNGLIIIEYALSYVFTRTVEKFVVPPGVDELNVKMWGAGGAFHS